MRARKRTAMLLVYGILMYVGANALVARTLDARLRGVVQKNTTHLELLLWATSYHLKDGLLFDELTYVIITADEVNSVDKRAVQKEFGLEIQFEEMIVLATLERWSRGTLTCPSTT